MTVYADRPRIAELSHPTYKQWAALRSASIPLSAADKQTLSAMQHAALSFNSLVLSKNARPLTAALAKVVRKDNRMFEALLSYLVTANSTDFYTVLVGAFNCFVVLLVGLAIN